MTASPINASKRLDLPATKTLKSVNGKYFLVMLLYPSCNKLCVPYVHPAVEASLRETSRVPCFIDHHHWYIGPAQTWSELILCVAEYASVGYMAKRIQMRKNRFLAIQKMAEQKKNEALHASNANINDASNNLDLGPGLPKQTVSPFSFKHLDSGLLSVDTFAAVNLNLPARCAIFFLIFPSNCVLHNPNHLRESVREIELGILDRRDLQGHLSLNCIVLEIAIARHAKALAIAKTAWFVLCLISRFAINNLIVLHIYLYITVFQHFKCPHLSSPNGIIYSGSPQKRQTQTMHCNEDCVWDKAKDNQGVEVCHTKYFWEVSPRAPTVWVKNKLCLFTTWQRRPKNPNVYFSFRPHIPESIWIST